MVAAIAVEAATYRVATLLIHRQRPAVLRLDHLPVNASYYSGHTAASVAVYCGVALLITSRIRSASRESRSVGWWPSRSPSSWRLSRMYRGMHHPTDVAAGMLVGIGSLLVAIARRPGGEGRRVAAEERAHDDRRRHRPRRQDASRAACPSFAARSPGTA